MNYKEIRFKINPEGGEGEVLAALLANIGYEGVAEENEWLTAYIPESAFDESRLGDTLSQAGFMLDYDMHDVPEQNWNEVWESQFEPVIIADKIYVRAPFHPSLPEFDYELLIEPRMSFGTAHHETTALMLEYLLELPLQGKHVLDMGCGTGILAILAAKRGAARIVAIDNDPWAVSNSKDNIQINHTPEIIVELGDASLLPNVPTFDLILANINRNILLNDMPAYNQALRPGGAILFSGFYIEDLPTIEAAAANLGLIKLSFKEKNRWVAAAFRSVDIT